MKLELQSNNIDEYLTASEIIDYDNHQIQDVAVRLSDNTYQEIELAKKVYEYVRDKIAHSWDIKSSIVTCEASQVLLNSHGLCFAKSHLLAALLRYSNSRLSKIHPVKKGTGYRGQVTDNHQDFLYLIHLRNAISQNTYWFLLSKTSF